MITFSFVNYSKHFVACQRSFVIGGLRSCSSSKTKCNFDKPFLVKLQHRSVLKLSGKDSLDFLQGLVTNDVLQLPSQQCMYSMMLDTRGRIMHDFIMYWLPHDSDLQVLLECEQESKDTILKTLKMYKLRKKVKIAGECESSVWQALGPNALDFDTVNSLFTAKSKSLLFKDPRTPLLGWRIISEQLEVSDDSTKPLENYHAHRLKLGVPEGANDLPIGKCSPLENNIDLMNGISFSKGCYLGQELTARTYHTGVIRKRLMPFMTETGLTLQYNDRIKSSDGKVTGKIRSSNSKGQGLALMKLESLQMKHFCSDNEILPYKPEWWPENLER
uniref:Putative transferase CAF17 homolog, mitochondrial n=1 Tax=Phallusia mammillata TaxID=59560 RepID=A0A6F9DFN9_9ASCI|nr:putative transferase CAF17 homolog, mitochondrial [Phallusia mammillata]